MLFRLFFFQKNALECQSLQVCNCKIRGFASPLTIVWILSYSCMDQQIDSTLKSDKVKPLLAPLKSVLISNSGQNCLGHVSTPSMFLKANEGHELQNNLALCFLNVKEGLVRKLLEKSYEPKCLHNFVQHRNFYQSPLKKNVLYAT